MLYVDKVIEDLQEWHAETGEGLPADARLIAASEIMGEVVDLQTGEVAGYEAPDGDVRLATIAPLRSRVVWLAALEAECDGNVRIAWAMTPDAYFAQSEAGKRA